VESDLGEPWHKLTAIARYSVFALWLRRLWFYCAIFFTYAPLVVDFYKVPTTQVGFYLLPFAIGIEAQCTTLNCAVV